MIKNSNKIEVTSLASLQEHDWRSTFGRNCLNLCDVTGAPSVKEVNIKDITIYPVPEAEKWRLEMITHMMDCRRGTLEVDTLSSEERDSLLDFICTV